MSHETEHNGTAGKKAFIATFGCQMNVNDSDRMAAMLAKAGYAPASRAEEADLVLVNTCSVREKAENKVYTLLGGLARLKKKRPGLIIGVAGCVAQQEGEKLLRRVGHLDLVLGADAMDKLPELVEAARAGQRGVAVKLDGAMPMATPAPKGQLAAFVTVMRGCDNFCSYCVVPYVRGRERSRPLAQVVAEAGSLADSGTREIHLLGQNVNSYRCPETGADFAGLLAAVAGLENVWRVRFTTSHPKDLSPALIAAMAGLPKVMESIHLPAQAGADRVLAAMNRGYTRAQYLQRVADLKHAVPGVAIGGDIIVGFPGETEEEFQQTMELLRQVRYDFLFSFKYSDRPFTKAGRIKEKLEDEIKADRLHRLQTLQREISLALHQELVGGQVEVLVEGPAKKGQGMMAGRDRKGRSVNFPGGPELAGRLVQVRVSEGRVNSLVGSLA